MRSLMLLLSKKFSYFSIFSSSLALKIQNETKPQNQKEEKTLLKKGIYISFKSIKRHTEY